MKLYYYALLIVLPLVAFSVTDVSAEALRGRNKRELASVEDTSAEAPPRGTKRELASSAYHVGKEMAEEYWDDGSYDCEFREVSMTFMRDVEDDVYDDCDYEFWPSNSYIRDCQKGAKHWVTEKANSCTSVSDCSGFGEPIARGIANDYCGSNRVFFALMGGSKPKLIPRECKKMARNNCKTKVAEFVEDKVKDGDCGDIDHIFDVDFDHLEDECTEEVRKFVKDANQGF